MGLAVCSSIIRDHGGASGLKIIRTVGLRSLLNYLFAKAARDSQRKEAGGAAGV